MPPVKNDCEVDGHVKRRRNSRSQYLQPTDATMNAVESGIESGPECSLSSSSSSSSFSSMKSKSLQQDQEKVHYGLMHEDNCGCPAADLQGMVIAQVCIIECIHGERK